MRETFPVLLGTLVSQTALNIVALAVLGGIIVASTDLFHRSSHAAVRVQPRAAAGAGRGGPGAGPGAAAQRRRPARPCRRGRCARRCFGVRTGLRVFRDPRRGSVAAAAQLGAWGIQLLACAALFEALGLHGQVGIGAAAAVLFAVNVTAVVPATPSNIGVFQLAVISVLTTGFGVGGADALAYGVILQAVEIATAVALGLPALVREGLTWSDMRLRALSAAPVRLSPRPAPRRPEPSPDQLARSRGRCLASLSPRWRSRTSQAFPESAPSASSSSRPRATGAARSRRGPRCEAAKAHQARELELHAGRRDRPDPLQRLLPLRPGARHDRARRRRSRPLRARRRPGRSRHLLRDGPRPPGRAASTSPRWR